MKSLEDKIIEMYKNGSELSTILQKLNITYKKVKKTLDNLRESSREGRSFSDDFRKIISRRDARGIPRKHIAEELGINVNTVKNACDKFGDKIKEKHNSENSFELVENVKDEDVLKYTKICNNCNNSLNGVEDNVFYCRSCDNEYTIKEDKLYKLNWEYVE